MESVTDEIRALIRENTELCREIEAALAAGQIPYEQKEH